MISLVIPAFNAASYLEQCIDSILKQTYTDFEIIVIDDGSTDDTRFICKKYEAKDSRIRYIHQKNAGVSAARNRGIENAKGDWIAFVDADDTVESRYLEYMIKAVSEKNADIVFCGFSVVGTSLRADDMSALCECCGGQETGVINSTQAIERMICVDPDKMFYGYVWRNLFSTSLLSKYRIRFQCDIKISEDYQFILEYLLHATQVALVAIPLYCYRVNDSSVTTKYMPSLHHDMNKINIWMYNNISFSSKALKNFYACKANTYLGAVQNLCRRGTPYSISKRITMAYQIKKKNHYTKALRCAVWQHNRIKACVAFLLFIFQLDWLYIVLFSIKENTFPK